MKERKKYYTWMRRVRKQLPDLTQRTFALRDKMYNGCGYHYDLESILGEVIKIANGHGFAKPYSAEEEILNEVIVEKFLKRLEEAEKSAIEVQEAFDDKTRDIYS